MFSKAMLASTFASLSISAAPPDLSSPANVTGDAKKEILQIAQKEEALNVKMRDTLKTLLLDVNLKFLNLEDPAAILKSVDKILPLIDKQKNKDLWAEAKYNRADAILLLAAKDPSKLVDGKPAMEVAKEDLKLVIETKDSKFAPKADKKLKDLEL